MGTKQTLGECLKTPKEGRSFEYSIPCSLTSLFGALSYFWQILIMPFYQFKKGV